MNNITKVLINNVANPKGTNIDMDQKIVNLKAIQNKEGKFNLTDINGKIILGPDEKPIQTEIDIEMGKLDDKMKYQDNKDGLIDGQIDFSKESTLTEFDFDVFKNLGINIDLKSKPSINTAIYAKSNMYTLSVDDQITLIKKYMEIESMRFFNQKLFNYSKNYEKVYHVFYVISIILNILLPYIPNIIDSLGQSFGEQYGVYFYGGATILASINYILTRVLMSSSFRGANHQNIQESLLKLRFHIEKMMVGVIIKSTEELAKEVALVDEDLVEINKLDYIKSIISDDKNQFTKLLRLNNLNISGLCDNLQSVLVAEIEKINKELKETPLGLIVEAMADKVGILDGSGVISIPVKDIDIEEIAIDIKHLVDAKKNKSKQITQSNI